MAFLLSTFGLSGIASQLLGMHHKHANPPAQTGVGNASFGSVLNGQMDALGASDPLAQLTTVVQNGTPISRVVDRLANLTANAVQNRLASASHAHLVSSIKSALSPPSNAPPGGTATQEVAALARRLQSWLTGVARGADQRAGQQSDTSGQVLDANKARELPAQHDPEPTSSTLDASALARSLLASVAASFGPASQAGTPSPLAASPAYAAVSAASQNAKASTSHASSLARLQNLAAIESKPSADELTQPQSIASDPANASAETAQSNSADLLARMMFRAAGVDAQFNGSAIATAALSVRGSGERTASAEHAAKGTVASESTSTQLTAAFTEAISSAANSSNDASSGNGDAGARNATSFSASASIAPAKNAVQTGALAFALTGATPGDSAQHALSANGSSAGASVDPNAIIEQVVKGLSMRTQSDGTSEVRLRLVPEQLGAVTVRLSVDGSNVSATAVAQNADVRNALMAHQHTLARSLAESGLKLTGFTVNLSGGDAGQDRNRDRTSGFGRQYAVHEVAAAGQSDSTESSAAGPALLPEKTLALFSYLA